MYHSVLGTHLSSYSILVMHFIVSITVTQNLSTTSWNTKSDLYNTSVLLATTNSSLANTSYLLGRTNASLMNVSMALVTTIINVRDTAITARRSCFW